VDKRFDTRTKGIQICVTWTILIPVSQLAIAPKQHLKLTNQNAHGMKSPLIITKDLTLNIYGMLLHLKFSQAEFSNTQFQHIQILLKKCLRM
jgi:hypothetical protein